ncbi:TnpC protein [Mycolicibacterium smegmatis MKD8]|uniref:TnpC protein n=1 Tax=Mycolicibacterium smegmatis (strain MKD8) TaxID=1214915 RepID=A0A2U9PT84_MYCSE|nr:TnpC protein [Mycolicibacterium smegmatis MKD8]
MTRNAAIDRAIDEFAWVPVKYPRVVRDPDTGEWISDAEVVEIGYTAFAATTDRFAARLVMCRVKDARFRDALFPVWRYHPFFTNTDLLTAEADITHRQHAIIETVFADLIDGPLTHMPSRRFGANSAWVLCAAISHNLLRAAGVLAGGTHGVARGATLRRKIITIPARLARPQRRPILHLPSHWPWTQQWLTGQARVVGGAAVGVPCGSPCSYFVNARFSRGTTTAIVSVVSNTATAVRVSEDRLNNATVVSIASESSCSGRADSPRNQRRRTWLCEVTTAVAMSSARNVALLSRGALGRR